MWRRGSAVACVLAAAVLAAAVLAVDAASGQEPPSTSWAWASPAPPSREPFQAPSGVAQRAPFLSLMLPGVGQHTQGRGRKWVYAALEVAAWAYWVDRRGAGFSLRDEYRDVAWERARLQAGTRVDGDFEYYERLTKWTRSGTYDRDPIGSGVQPEADPGSFNGSIWLRARQLFFSGRGDVPRDDPAYAAALGYYEERAYRTEFLWDWSGAQGAQQEFAELISESDDRFRRATTALGVVLANHLISAVDAFLVERGRRAPLRVDVAPGGGLGGLGWSVRVRLFVLR